MTYPPYQPYGMYMDMTARMQILTFHVHLPWIGTGRTLIVGDSITENLIPNGFPHIVMLGVSGARAHDFLPFAQEIMSIVQPSKVVLAVGTNDMADPSLTFWNWQQDYWNLAQTLQASLMTILPTEKVTQPYLAAHNNPAELQKRNDYIKETGKYLGLKVQDASAALAGPDGYLPQGSTADGLHPLGALNAPLWAQFEAAMT